jgi:hypothetical protein
MTSSSVVLVRDLLDACRLCDPFVPAVGAILRDPCRPHKPRLATF